MPVKSKGKQPSRAYPLAENSPPLSFGDSTSSSRHLVPYSRAPALHRKPPPTPAAPSGAIPNPNAPLDIPAAVKTLKRLAVYPKRRDPEYIEQQYSTIRPALLAATDDDVGPMQLTQLWYMLAKMKRVDGELIGKLIRATDALVERLDPYGCSNILWSIAVLEKAARHGDVVGSGSRYGNRGDLGGGEVRNGKR